MNPDQLTLFQFNEEAYKKFNLPVKDKRELVALINETIYRKCAKTAKEKFEVLDMRDKVLKLIRFDLNNQKSNYSWNSSAEDDVGPNPLLAGSCQDMCPEKERYSRDYLSLCSKYEMVYTEESSSNVIDYNLMVKEYSRSSADQDLPLPNEMRPPLVLYDTMLYLINQVITQIESAESDENSEFSAVDWYDFIWNRTRSIRKDIIQQRLLLNENTVSLSIEGANEDDQQYNAMINCLGGVLIIEQCARFHIMCSYRLCEEGPDVFDFKINEENLKNCFQSLRQYYEATAGSASGSPNEAEFRAYIILLNLNESNILSAIQRWPKHMRHAPAVRFALAVYFAYNSRNYVAFFRLVVSDECQYLQACVLHRYFYKVRCDAFKAIFSAFKENKDRAYPLEKLAQLLGFSDQEGEVLDYCNEFGLELSEDASVLMRASSAYACFNLSKASADKLKARKSTLLIESKFYSRLNEAQLTADECLSEIISGGDLRHSRFSQEQHELQNSFNEEGFYASDEIEELLRYARGQLAKINKPDAAKNVIPTAATASIVKNLDRSKLKSTQAAASAAAASTTGKAANNILLQRATSLIKKAQQTSILKKQQINANSEQLMSARSRKKTASSSSNSSESASVKSVSTTTTTTTTSASIFKSAKAFQESPTTSQQQQKSLFSLLKSNNEYNNNTNMLFGSKHSATAPNAQIVSSNNAFGGQTTTSSSANLSNNPFSSIINKTSQQQPLPPAPSTFVSSRLTMTRESSTASSASQLSLFSTKPAMTSSSATNTPIMLFGGTAATNTAPTASSTLSANSLFQQATLKPTGNNLFSNLLSKKIEATAATATTTTQLVGQQQNQQQQLQQQQQREKTTEQMCENTFQSVYLELVRDLAHEFMFKLKSASNDLANDMISESVSRTVRSVASEVLVEERQETALQRAAEDLLCTLLDDITSSTCTDLVYNFSDLEYWLLEEMLCTVFQAEFEVILKQIASELNREIKLDKLAEALYFNNSQLCQQQQTEENEENNLALFQMTLINSR